MKLHLPAALLIAASLCTTGALAKESNFEKSAFAPADNSLGGIKPPHAADPSTAIKDPLAGTGGIKPPHPVDPSMAIKDPSAMIKDPLAGTGGIKPIRPVSPGQQIKDPLAGTGGIKPVRPVSPGQQIKDPLAGTGGIKPAPALAANPSLDMQAKEALTKAGIDTDTVPATTPPKVPANTYGIATPTPPSTTGAAPVAIPTKPPVAAESSDSYIP